MRADKSLDDFWRESQAEHVRLGHAGFGWYVCGDAVCKAAKAEFDVTHFTGPYKSPTSKRKG